jgi:hypothetical protein
VISKDQAKKLLGDDDTCASIRYLAARALYSDELHDTEPETLELDFVEMGIEMAPAAWDALHAAITIREQASAFTDASVFENTVLAFNGTPVIPDAYQQASPDYIAWAVNEINELTQDMFDEGTPDEYLDYEPAGYAAASCMHDGMCCVPPSLEFCEERLHELTRVDKDVVQKVKKGWGRLDQDKLADTPFDESPTGIQLALMAGIELYVEEMKAKRERQLASL